MGRPDRPAAGAGRAGRRRRLCAVLAGVRRGPGRDPRRPGSWRGGWSARRRRPRGRAPVGAAGHGAGHRRDRGDRRARGPVAGRARRRRGWCWPAGRARPRPGSAALAAELAAAGTAVERGRLRHGRPRRRLAALLARIGAGGPPLSGGHARRRALAQDARWTRTRPWPSWPRCWRPRRPARRYLDELTAELDLDAFVLFSSIAATWGSGGQRATRRRTRSWTRWPQRRRGRGLAGDVGGLGSVGRRRDDRRARRRAQLRAARAAADGPRSWRCAALGQVLDGGEDAGDRGRRGLGAVRAAVHRAAAQPADRGPARGPRRRWPSQPAAAAAGAGGAATALARRLAGLPAAEQDRVLIDLVRAEAAAVLGHASPEAVEAGPGVPRPGLRLADRGGAAEPAERGDRAAAARHAGLRLPDPGRLAAQFLRAELLGVPAAARHAGGRRPRRSAGEPVAIVGMGCRFPGGVRRPGGAVGAARRRAPTRSRGSRPTGAGTWTSCTTPIRITRGRRTRAQGGFVYDAAGVRRGVLRDQPAGGAGHGPAAAAAARGVLGGAGAGRDRPGVAARLAGPGCSRARRRPGTAPGCAGPAAPRGTC